MNFIYTYDIQTANQLRILGYQEIDSEMNGIYVFVNQPTLKIPNNIDLSKIKYSNVLCV